MDAITGFVPTGQEIDPAYRSKNSAFARSRQLPRSAGRAVAGFILLLLGFCLLLLGGTLFSSPLASIDGQVGRHSGAGGNLENDGLAYVKAVTPACAGVIDLPMSG